MTEDAKMEIQHILAVAKFRLLFGLASDGPYYILLRMLKEYVDEWEW